MTSWTARFLAICCFFAYLEVKKQNRDFYEQQWFDGEDFASFQVDFHGMMRTKRILVQLGAGKHSALGRFLQPEETGEFRGRKKGQRIQNPETVKTRARMEELDNLRAVLQSTSTIGLFSSKFDAPVLEEGGVDHHHDGNSNAGNGI